MLTVFLSGFLMPVAFLPDWMQTLMRFTFFPSMINTLFSYGGSAMFSYPMYIYADWMRRFFIFVVSGGHIGGANHAQLT